MKKYEYDYLDLLKCKFKYDGQNINEGFDCMTLVIEIGKRRNVKIPNLNYLGIDLLHSHKLFTETNYIDYFKEVPKQENTIVLMKNPYGVIGHVGFMIDKNNFIHMTADKGVMVTKVTDKIYKNRIVGYYLPK
jgi:cell wall-associated NlpC family hydrolase